VNWESLAEAESAHLYEETWPKVYFTPVVDALKAICADDMGRDALKAVLKKVVIENKNGVYSASQVAAFADGVLTIDHKPCTNVDDVADRTTAITKLLESKL